MNSVIRSIGLTLLTLSIVGSAATHLYAQGLTGQIGGTVVDAQKSSVPGATVTVRNTGTQATREVVTDKEGKFVITNILAGTYDLRVTLSGFRSYEQRGIALTSTERVSVPPIVLEVGGVSSEVTVAAAAQHVQAQSGERSATITAAQIQDVGLRGRDFMGTLKVLPGVVDTSAREAPGWGSVGGMTINGMSNFNFSYDGVTSKDTGSNTGNYAAPALDSIAEVKVQASNFQAEYGRSAGATIVVVTKSGSSRFNGSAAYYKRHEGLNANSWDRRRSCDAAKALGNASAFCANARYRYDNSALTLGGPVLIPGTEFNRNRDKLFFFYSLDLLPRTDPSAVQRTTMPTALERNGDFSQTVDSQNRLRFIRDPLSGGACNITSGGPGCFPGNIIPANRRNALGMSALNVFPLPNTTDPTGNRGYNHEFESPIEKLRRENVVRVDYNVRPGTSFYTRLQAGKEINARGYGGTFLFASTNWPMMRNSYDINTFSTVSTLNHTFTPTTVLEVTAGMNWSEQLVYPLSQAEVDRNDYTKVLSGATPFYPEANPLHLLPNMTFSGSNALPGTPSVNFENRFPFTAQNPIKNVSANLTHLRGAHNMKTGIVIERTARPAQRSSSFNGTYNFNSDSANPFDTNFGYANAVLGTILAYTESTKHPYAEGRFNQTEFFVQDNWRMNRKFTLDYGLRMVYMGPTYVAGQQLAYFDPTKWDASKAPKLYVPVCQNGAATCSGAVRVAKNPVTGAILNSTFIGKIVDGTGDPANGMVVADGTPPQFSVNRLRPAPRVGFGWDITGDGKTAVRGGFGTNYDRYSDDTVLQQVESLPLMNTFTTNWTTLAQLQSSPFIRNPASVQAFTDIQPLTVHNWSLGVQRELPFRLLADVAYVGNITRNNARNIPINSLQPAQLNTSDRANMDPTQNFTQRIPDDLRRPYTGLSGINERRYFKDGLHYHSIQVGVSRRMANGFAGSVAYTGSRRSGLQGWDYFRTDAENRARHTHASGSRPHNLVFSYNYLVPGASRFLGENIVAKGVLDGWQVSGVTSLTGGTLGGFGYSFTGAPTGDLTQGLGGSRVTLVCNPNIPRSERTFDRQFNTDCIRPAGPSSDPSDTFYQGTSLGDERVGLGFVNHDITLFKNFAMANRRNLQIRIEMYNAFNTTQYSGVDTNAVFDFATGVQTKQTFGQVTGVRGSSNRVIQLGTRFTF
ncbi:MAG: carboxypeptidase-like regulatory domain-containing protein [Vicinamibacterales bacterium]